MLRALIQRFPAAKPTPHEVQEAVQAILRADVFKNAENPSKLLQHVVEVSLQGKADELKETTIGTDLFGRPAGYDPREDNIVRRTAVILRSKLDAYFRIRFATVTHSYGQLDSIA